MTQIRGIFPLPQISPQICGIPSVITLVSGGVYYFPAGNYLTATGANTAMQWFDPLVGQWRPSIADQPYGMLNADWANYRLLNMTGTVTSLALTAGSAGTNGIGPAQTGTSISFTVSPTGAQAEGYVIVGGSVPAPTVTQGGSGFVVPPVICCDPPPVGGIQATFVCTITAGAIATVTQVNAGAGYTSVPQFYIIPQPHHYQGMPRWPGDTVPNPFPPPGLIHPSNVWPGTVFQPNININGALLTGNALTGSGTLTGIVMDNVGGGYATAGAPTVAFTGGTLTGAAATATVATAPANDTSYVQAKVN